MWGDVWMGLLNFFKRKEEELPDWESRPLDQSDVSKFPELNLNKPIMLEQESPFLKNPQQPSIQPFSPTSSAFSFQAPQQQSPDLQIVSAKLDTLKVLLESVLQRMDQWDKQKKEEVIRWK